MRDLTQKDRELRLLAEGREKLLSSIMKAEKEGKTAGMPYLNFLIRQELDLLAADIKADNKAGGGAGAFKKFALYLGSLNPQIVALRAIQGLLATLIKAGGADQPQPVGREAAKSIGRAVYSEYLMTNFKHINPPLFNSLLREYGKSMTSDEAHLIKAFKAKYANEGYEFPTWGLGDMEHVGRYLLNRMAAHAFIELWTRTERKNGRPNMVMYVALATDLRSSSLDLIDRVADNPSISSPLIEPPLDWNADTNSGGGYHSEDMQRQLAYAVLKNGMRPVSSLVIDNLNYLQRTPFVINGEVLDMVRSASLKLDFGKVVALDPGPKPELGDEHTADEKAEWKKAMRGWWTEKKVRAVLYSKAQRVFREAQDLRQYPAVYFAWYADNRGRKYARASGVSPQGTDLEKGLIKLRDGKALTEEGIQWFLMHGANKYGISTSFADRLDWVRMAEAAIIAAASGDNDDFWTAADAPVSFLAWAIEFKAWVESGRSPAFVSYLPLGQDGTCNGLQHYSGLLADAVGGRAVNLTCGLKPNDVYLDVANATYEALDKAPASAFKDMWVKHGVSRYWAKRPTMTLPYGCTRFGTSEFLNEYLEGKTPEEFPKSDYGDAANWLSHVMWETMPAVLPKAMEGMEWITGWAKHTASIGQAVSWVAPNGLRVVSQYEKVKNRIVQSAAFKTRIRMVEPTGKIDVKKTAQAVAPNFIHSMDGSHLDFIILRARQEGIVVVAIHDDYGTYAADTAWLHRAIREEFVKMYLDNTILERMGKATGYPVPPPAKGELNIREVLDSPYFFS